MNRGSLRAVAGRSTFVVGICLLLSSCGSCSSEESRSVEPAPPHEPIEIPPAEPWNDDASIPRLPQAGPLYPETQVRLVEGDPRDADTLADVDACGACHEDVVRNWQASPHSRASFDNPWYRQSVDALREESGNEASRFCAGCHDPVLLIADAMHEPVLPEDPRAHAGVTCRVCHGIQQTGPDGAGSYTLRTGPIPFPNPGDEAEVAVHIAAVTPAPLRTADLCASCHRGFLGPHMGNPHHLGGIDDVTPYRRSGYAGSPATRIDEPVEAATCQGCHMPEATATHGDFAADDESHYRSHRFAGAHTGLAQAAGDTEQLAAVRRNLADAARIDVAGVRSARRGRRSARWLVANGAPVRAGDSYELDVVVRNIGAGHRFPGGSLDAQDTWIEVEVRDSNHALIAEAGTRHGDQEDDPTAHRLMALLVDENAEPRWLHRVERFRAKVYDRTIPPRNAQVVRYALDVPDDVAMPLSVRARLRHRRHTRAMNEAACVAQRSDRGRAFIATATELGRTPLDVCGEQPITELATATVFIGEGAETRLSEGGALMRPFRRHFDYALGLLTDVQEHLDDARPALAAALEAAETDHERAMALLQRARLEGRQGRLEASLADAQRADALLPAHPATARARGDAYAQVWRWEDAAREYAIAAEGAPLDDSRWIDLARARGSHGDDEGALAAAVRGLMLSPRNESLLRSQYLALEQLERPGRDEASDAYLAHRIPDELSALRLRCGQQHAWCAEERLPVHIHPLRPVVSAP